MILVVLAEWSLTKLQNPSFLQNKTPSNFKKNSSDTGPICIVIIYGPVTCSLCEKCVRKYRPKFSQNHMVRN